MFDLLIINGKMIDGSGKNPPRVLDVGIKKDRIAEIGNFKIIKTKKTIDAKGKFVTPGFIDAQNHSDAYWTLFDYPGQESMLAQGITTITVGNCGASLAPLPSLESFKSIQKWRSPEGENINWTYFDEYLQTLSKLKLGVNVLSLTGHSTMRRGLLGDSVRKITSHEMKIMERLLTSSFKQGSCGLSLGLIYAHEYDSSPEELEALTKITEKHNRPISIHLRNESDRIIEAIGEAVSLAEKTTARLKISHFKIRGHKNWHLYDQAIQSFELAHQRGANIRFDLYPYTTSWTILYTYLPKWAYEGGKNELNKKLQDPFSRKKIIEAIKEQGRDFSGITIATASSSPHLIGKTLAQIAGSQGVVTEEAIVNVLSSTESEVVVFDENICADHLEGLIKHPLSIISSNGAGFPLEDLQTKNLVHPRCFGAMPRFLHLILKNKWLTPEKAVYKITGAPAEYLGLKNRGILKNGNIADIVVFDQEKIRDLATTDNPYQRSQGISDVIMGGNVAMENEQINTEKYGTPLKI